MQRATGRLVLPPWCLTSVVYGVEKRDPEPTSELGRGMVYEAVSCTPGPGAMTRSKQQSPQGVLVRSVE